MSNSLTFYTANKQLTYCKVKALNIIGLNSVYCRVREFRNGSTPVLYLNAGDTYTGSPWFNVYKHRIVSEFLNILRPDAVVSRKAPPSDAQFNSTHRIQTLQSLGNHELDDNVAGLIPYLNDAEFPVLAANLDLTGEPELAAIPSLRKSVVLTVRNIRVGIIGYLTPYTQNITAPNNITYLPEVPSIK